MSDKCLPPDCRCQAAHPALSRRDVLHGSVASAVLCCKTEELPTASFRVADGKVEINLKNAGALAKPGGAAKVVDIDRNVNLIVVQSRKGQFAALERSCTHGGAQVVYNSRNGTVQCTSWGHSEFALDGQVLGGSARKPLPAHVVRRVGDRLEITLAVQS
jgi:nitrite reductase/ring-hydroxylating ferredoxin subunit